MLIQRILPVLSLAALLSCQSSQTGNTMSNAQTNAKSSDWKPLFDGKTTNGWHSYGKETAGKAWKAEDGMLRLDASAKKDWQTNEGGDIVTEESYEDFHLKLDWKIAQNGNSGIIIYVQDEPAKYQYVWQTGPEIQVLDNDGHPDAKIHKHRAGDLYDLVASSPETVKPAGQWNRVEIISQNGKLEVVQNGQKVLTTTMWDDNWRNMIAGSKFSQMPGFGTFKSGKIALQDHGDDVWFKNIMIKRL